MVEIIPRSAWPKTTSAVLWSQPGVRIELKLSHDAYTESFKWAEDMFGDDLILGMWHSPGNIGQFIFKHGSQAMLFKLTWAGK